MWSLNWDLHVYSLTRAGVLYDLGLLLGDLREPRQLKPEGEPLQFKAFSTIKRALSSC